jgi:hypothetical protein
MSFASERASPVSWRGEIGRMQRCRSLRIGAAFWFAGHPINNQCNGRSLDRAHQNYISRGVNAAPGTSSVKANVGSRKRQATMAYSPSSGTGSRSKPDKSTLTEAAPTLLAASGSARNTDALERALNDRIDALMRQWGHGTGMWAPMPVDPGMRSVAEVLAPMMTANDIAWLILLTASNCDTIRRFDRRWRVLEKAFEGLVSKDGARGKMN